MHKEGVKDKATELTTRLAASGLRVKTIFQTRAPLEICRARNEGHPAAHRDRPEDIENGQCVAVRRDNSEKIAVPLDALEEKIPAILEDVQKGLYEKALKKSNRQHAPGANR